MTKTNKNSHNQNKNNIEKSEFKMILNSFREAFNLNQGLIPTIRDLVLSPLKVVEAYFRGEKKYFGPGKFFVFCLGLYGLTLWLGPKYEVSNLINDMDINDKEFQKLEIVAEKSMHTIMTSPSGILITVIPIYSIICWIIFRNRSLSQHFIIQVYCLSLLMGISLLPYIGYYGQTIEIVGSQDMTEHYPLGITIGSYTVICITFIYLTYVNYHVHRINLALSAIKTTLAFGFSFMFGIFISCILLITYYYHIGS